jgi:hypothetical protein
MPGEYQRDSDKSDKWSIVLNDDEYKNPHTLLFVD